MKTVGWIGVGNMGSRMSRRLMEAGWPLWVYDINPAACQKLVQNGAQLAASPARLAQSCDYVFTMVPNTAVLRQIVDGPEGLLQASDFILVDMSTLDPAGSAEIAARLAEAGIRYLRAPVTGSTEFAEKGTLGIMASGDEAVYKELLPLLQVLGNRQSLLGNAEQARHMKIAINMMVGVTMQMLAESLVLGEKVGIEWETLVDLIADSAAAAPIVKFKTEALKKRDFAPMATAMVLEKDLQLALDIAKDEALALPLTAFTKQYYAAMRAAGQGALDYSAILLVNEKLNGLEHEHDG